jgi:CheY-like chemotaxis protein
MDSKLKCIVLIDDDEPTNFLHQRVIERYGCAERVIVFQDAKLALKFLSERENGVYVQPELILLDINMPGMNGWEFLEAYENLPAEQRGQIVVMMLTTSLNPDDAKYADSVVSVARFLNKPLTSAMLQEILAKYFGR